MEQRHYFRAKLDNTEVYISDSAGFCTGTLKDFSRFGLCITDLPRRVHAKNGHFTAILSSNNMKFKLKVEERWSAKLGLSNEIGAMIDDAPWDWTEMAMQHEPLQEDVWATQ